jgi:H+/Cl- antiporter ClcA
MKAFNIIWCILFILFAALQYNDPDPYIWVPIYLYASILCWLAFRGRYYSAAYLIGIVIYIAYAVYLVLAKDGVWDWMVQHEGANIAGSMHAEKPWIEQTREFFGLVILITVLTINFFYVRRKMQS